MKDKWGRGLFKVGGVLLILLGLVHSISLFHQMEPENATEKQLLDLMNNYRFNLMGSLRNMAELLRGFSMAFTMGTLALGVLDLSLSAERDGLLKRVALINVLYLGVMTANSVRYFFAMPTIFLLMPLVIFAAAWAKLPGQEPSSQ
jgi:hypothetical protein